MTMKSDYEAYIKQQNTMLSKPLSRFWSNQEDRYVKPFQIYGNLYYVGDSWVCVHIVDTGNGLLMFDAGNSGAEAMLVHAIWELGFNPSDVKWLILSHGHVDHFGAARFFKRMFGTQIYLGEPDSRMFREEPQLSMIQESGNCMDTLVPIDIEIHDQDVLQFGNTEVIFYLVPGHTRGCISCFFDVTNGKDKKRVGYYGGFGFNTLQEEYLLEIGDSSFEMRNLYFDSLEKVKNENVDIFMGNHTANVDLLNKRQEMLSGSGRNPFIDKRAWKKYLSDKQNELLELKAQTKKND